VRISRKFLAFSLVLAGAVSVGMSSGPISQAKGESIKEKAIVIVKLQKELAALKRASEIQPELLNDHFDSHHFLLMTRVESKLNDQYFDIQQEINEIKSNIAQLEEAAEKNPVLLGTDLMDTHHVRLIAKSRSRLYELKNFQEIVKSPDSLLKLNSIVQDRVRPRVTFGN